MCMYLPQNSDCHNVVSEWDSKTSANGIGSFAATELRKHASMRAPTTPLNPACAPPQAQVASRTIPQALIVIYLTIRKKPNFSRSMNSLGASALRETRTSSIFPKKLPSL